MKEVVVISGKGGTGKTSLTSSLAYYFENRIMVDCDVDAPDLEIVFKPENYEEFDFIGAKKARINQEKCTSCGLCRQVCNFDAVNLIDGKYTIDNLNCESCGACVYFCPVNAIDFEPEFAGKYFRGKTRFGELVHAELEPGEENSGKLVVTVKKEAEKIINQENIENMLSDGTPGIGCAVIASISGADYTVCVTEPGVSAIHDMKRVLELTRHFGIKCGVIINKADINPDKTLEIETFLLKNNICLLGKINFDKNVINAQINGQTIPEFDKKSDTALRVESIYKKLVEELNG